MYSAGFVYPWALMSHSQSGSASLPPRPAVRTLEGYVGSLVGLEGDKVDSGLGFGMAGEVW